MKYHNIIARLLDIDGLELCTLECDTMKEARERCRYWLSRAYAAENETTHTRLRTWKAEVIVNGVCLWDRFLPAQGDLI